ncbi:MULTISPECIES: YIP1 family protein [Halobacterium]|uniref:YIP1 family protein n=1 Tax=Halobacterium TaxID=2239 RepID=UPI0019649995|nr:MULTISPECIES: YIP1 family protein [Halobacterium]MDL0123345.1 YIP1 family protein [Halobacterium salinarum]MDL0145328.1 YIP1 family protein [Halobacterium salinarum]QRY24988.1 YIP1 family protein [Halobacterium sp. BOL4-2]
MAPRTPFLHPREYFDQHGFDLRPAAVVAGVAALSLALVLIGFGVLLSNKLAAAGGADAASTIWPLVGASIVGLVLALAVGWVLIAGVLHVFARAIIGHDGRFTETFAIVGWGTAPTALTGLALFVALAVAVDGATVSSPELFLEQFQATLQRTSAVRTAISFAVAGWQTYLYAHGLAVAFDDDSEAPWLAGGVIAYGSWLLTLF